jgi:hypothetical protein
MMNNIIYLDTPGAHTLAIAGPQRAIAGASLLVVFRRIIFFGAK